jgi:hypothetical protein
MEWNRMKRRIKWRRRTTVKREDEEKYLETEKGGGE